MKMNYNIFHIICFYTFAFCYNTLQIYIYIIAIFVIFLLSLKQHEKNTKYRTQQRIQVLVTINVVF